MMSYSERSKYITIRIERATYEILITLKTLLRKKSLSDLINFLVSEFLSREENKKRLYSMIQNDIEKIDEWIKQHDD